MEVHSLYWLLYLVVSTAPWNGVHENILSPIDKHEAFLSEPNLKEFFLSAFQCNAAQMTSLHLKSVTAVNGFDQSAELHGVEADMCDVLQTTF